MNAPRDTDRLINAFLEDGLTELPDRAFDVVRGEIHQTRQRVVIGPWRQPNMSNFVRVAFAAAVVGAFALAWVNFGPQPGVGTAPTPSPTRSSEPTATPSGSAASLCSPCVPGPLDPGAYFFEAGTFTLPRMMFAVPAGWAIDADGFITKHADSADEVFFAAFRVTHIFPDACIDDESTVVAAGTTPAELASLLAAQKSRVASATTDVNVSGLPAKRLELAVPADLEGTTCDGSVRPWPDPGPNFNGGYCCLAAGSVEDVSIVEVMGDLIVVVARHEPESSAADQAELDSIVDSLVIDHPTPSLAPSGASAAP